MPCCVLPNVPLSTFDVEFHLSSSSPQEPNRKQGQYWYPPDAQGSLVLNQKFFEALIAACKSAVSKSCDLHVTLM